MSLLRLASRDSGVAPENAPVYRRKFVTTVYQVLAIGFQRLDSTTLATKEETALTGLVVDQMRLVVQGRDCPEGAEHFSIHDDRPESHRGREGKQRGRVDIVVERTGIGPRPMFRFEAKRLNDSGSVAAYLGDDGLGCFISGKYAEDDPDAGMLGYVQSDRPDDWAARIARKLDKERSAHGLDATGLIWHVEALTLSLKHCYRTTHKRNGQRFEIFHVLLSCVA